MASLRSIGAAALLGGVGASVDLMIVGDWGGIPFPPWSTPAQRAAAAGMGKIAAQNKATAVIALGDNFYFDGIRNDDELGRFGNTFEAVYTDPSLSVPWYLLAGNHDHYGNVTAEVDYTQQSERWNFPALYHNQSFVSSEDGTTVDIIFIDTVDLAGNWADRREEDHPGYYDPLPPRSRSDAAGQWDWIEAQMAASTADYLIVAGHYPVYSVCEHGNTQNLQDNLKPLLIQYGAHTLAGHDHCMSSVKDDNNLMYIVSGMGNTCCTSETHLDDVPAEYLQWYVSKETKDRGVIGGFTSLKATKENLFFTFYDQDGNELYTNPADISPRQKK